MDQESLVKWVKEAEDVEVAKNLLYFRQGVGLKMDARRLGALEKRTQRQALALLKHPEGCSRPLLLLCADRVGSASTYRQLLALHDARTLRVVSKRFRFKGARVNWGSWRQFAASTDDSTARKELFDEFVAKSAILAPLIRERFEKYKLVVAEHRVDPLAAYLEHERTSYEALIGMVQRLGAAARSPFQQALRKYAGEILGRDAEYYDDYYFFRSRVFRRYAERLPTRKEPVSTVVRTLKEMGLDASRVKVDSMDRPGKSASAFCSPIRVPTDVRISYRRSNPLENFSSIFHEFGHGIHFSSIDPGASFADRYSVANGVSETFSIFFEGLVHERLYLTEELGVPREAADDIIERFRFNQLFFAAFYAANSTLKLIYWHDGTSFERMDELYADLTERFMGIRYPGAYWKLHHVMPEYILYSPSYLIAAVRALELRNLLVARFGERYWKEKGAGKEVDGLMRPGQSLDLGFSKLDEGAYVSHLAGS